MPLYPRDQVRARVNIRGLIRERAPAGTLGGVVTSGYALRRAGVRFTLPGNLTRDERTLVVEVDDREGNVEARASRW